MKELEKSETSLLEKLHNLDILVTNMNQALVGQSQTILLSITALLAGGHVLLEDVPGVGKTLLARSLANSISAIFKRIQCTPDLLPSDVSGINIYDQIKAKFSFEPGPIFTNILLADEINRATPRTQSSLLEAMEEGQVTIDGETHKLPELFFVIATQNPIEYHGTFPLPEAQLDRFMFCLKLGYPSTVEEIEILNKTNIADSFSCKPVISLTEILEKKQLVPSINVDQSIKAYIVEIAKATRAQAEIILGVSPRGCQLLMRACQAYALLLERNFVSPHDVKLLAPFVFGHRIIPKQRGNKVSHSEIIERLLKTIPIPQ